MMLNLTQEANPWWRDPKARIGRGWPRRRDVFQKVLERVQAVADRRGVVLLGPRQVGKSVLLRQVADALLDSGLPPARLLRFDFSDDRLPSTLPSPREVLSHAPLLEDGERPVLLLDELQRVDRWDAWLKQIIDDESAKVLATGSSALLLHQGAIESGKGRWDEVRIEGLTYQEFLRLGTPHGEPQGKPNSDPASLERYQAIGGAPEHLRAEPGSELRRRIRADVVDRAILKDLLPTEVDVAKVKDLFLYLVDASGSEFVAARRAEDADIKDSRTVRDYLRQLEDAGLVALLEKYPARVSGTRPSARDRLGRRPKVYAADHGAIVAFSHRLDPLADATTRGQVHEALVFRHLRWAASELDVEDIFFFRRNRDGLEIDFILQDSSGLTGVEVTSGAPSRSKLRRLAQAGELLGLQKTILISPPSIEVLEGIHRIDLLRFLVDPVAALVP